MNEKKLTGLYRLMKEAKYSFTDSLWEKAKKILEEEGINIAERTGEIAKLNKRDEAWIKKDKNSLAVNTQNAIAITELEKENAKLKEDIEEKDKERLIFKKAFICCTLGMSDGFTLGQRQNHYLDQAKRGGK